MENQGGKFLTFLLGEEVYGLPLQQTREIIGIMEITHIPKTKGYIKGVVNLRGKIIPIIDLRVRFGMEAKEYTERTCIVLVEADNSGSRRLVGIVVDAVADVVNIADGELEAPPENDTRIKSDFLTGLGKFKDKVVMILNIPKILTNQ